MTSRLDLSHHRRGQGVEIAIEMSDGAEEVCICHWLGTYESHLAHIHCRRCTLSELSPSS